VVTISSTIAYTSKVLDPWFQATSTSNTNLTGSQINYIFPNLPTSDIKSLYYPDRISPTLGCTEQYQFCNNTSCSKLTGFFANDSMPYFGLELNDDQKAIFNLIYNGAYGVTLNMGVYFLGDNFLLATEKTWSGWGWVSSPLPPNQWEKEAANIVNIMLAALQRRILDFASPPDIPFGISSGEVSSLSFITPPQTEAEKRACNIVRIRNSAYYNFNVDGIISILSLGLIIIVINALCLPGIVFWARRKFKLKMHPKDEWVHTSVLALFWNTVKSRGLRRLETHKRGDTPYPKISGLRFSVNRAWKTRDKEQQRNHQLHARRKCSRGEISNEEDEAMLAKGDHAGRASGGDFQEGAWAGASTHAGQHGQPSIDVQEQRPVERGRRAGRASDGDSQGAWAGVS